MELFIKPYQFASKSYIKAIGRKSDVPHPQLVELFTIFHNICQGKKKFLPIWKSFWTK